MQCHLQTESKWWFFNICTPFSVIAMSILNKRLTPFIHAHVRRSSLRNKIVYKWKYCGSWIWQHVVLHHSIDGSCGLLIFGIKRRQRFSPNTGRPSYLPNNMDSRNLQSLPWQPYSSHLQGISHLSANTWITLYNQLQRSSTVVRDHRLRGGATGCSHADSNLINNMMVAPNGLP